MAEDANFPSQRVVNSPVEGLMVKEGAMPVMCYGELFKRLC